MDDQEHSPLLNGRVPEYPTTPPTPDSLTSNTVPGFPKIIKPRRKIVIEPVLFLYCTALVGSMPVMEQYLYARFATEYPILNKTNPENDTHTPCDKDVLVNYSDPVYIATQKVQAQTSQWQMYLQMLSSLLSVFTTLVYGAYSDSAGRRMILILPTAAAVVKFIINCFVIYFKLSVYVLLAGQVLDGLCGGFSTVMMGTFAYLADTTTPEQRGMRIAIAEACLTLAMAISQFGLGYYIRATGYFWPYLTMTGVLMINMIYIVFFVPETVVRDKDSKFSVLSSFKRVFAVFSEKTGRRHVKVICLVFAVMLYMFPWSGKMSLQILFTMNIPLCWNSVVIGIYSAVSALVLQFGGLIGLKLFKMCHMTEIWIAILGCLSAVANGLTNAYANTTLLMMIVCAVGLLQMLPIAMYRTILSRLVRVDEQGTIFSGVASVESLASLIGTLVLNLIYQKTLYFMQGFVFIVMAIASFLSLLLALVLIVKFGSILGVPATRRVSVLSI